jgi:hypothetical protein
MIKFTSKDIDKLYFLGKNDEGSVIDEREGRCSSLEHLSEI